MRNFSCSHDLVQRFEATSLWPLTVMMYREVIAREVSEEPWFDLQLDAQYSCLFTYNTFIKLLYMFRALPCSSSGGLRRNCIYAASGIVTLCR